jgi:quinol monooxygenase YgiN
MSEVVVVATLHGKPDRAAEFEAAYVELVASTHNEDGCLLYALHRSVADPAELVMIERWASREALEAHRTNPAIKQFSERTAEMVAAPAVVTVYEAIPAGEHTKGRL